MTNTSCPGPADLEGLRDSAAPLLWERRQPTRGRLVFDQPGSGAAPPTRRVGPPGPASLLLPVHRELLGDSASPIPEERQVLLGAHSLSCVLTPTAMAGRTEEEEPGDIPVAFRYSRNPHPFRSRYSRRRVQKPHPQKAVKNTLQCLADRETGLKHNSHAEAKWTYSV